jgi:hypothetical protein
VIGWSTAMRSKMGSESIQSKGGKKTSKPHPGPSEIG